VLVVGLALSASRRATLAQHVSKVAPTEKFEERDFHERRHRSPDILPFKARQRLLHPNRGLRIDQSLHPGRKGQSRPSFHHASESSPRSIAQHLGKAVTLLLNRAGAPVTRLESSLSGGVTELMNGKAVTPYLRVSTDRQGRSGLGLEAQRIAVESYVARTGATIAREFVEVESGKNNDRPKLAAAIAFARRSKATLLVAKLDRLARNVKFIATVLESGVEFAAADMPDANRMTLHILAAIAEGESKAISERTRAALQVAKARGVKLGTNKPLTPEQRANGVRRSAQSRRRAAVEIYSDLAPMVKSMRSEGATLAAIAEHLNAEGHATRTGAEWSKVQVHRVLSRAAA
jgi:DNA invertase Pin-like site-specific DNA recombinase